MHLVVYTDADRRGGAESTMGMLIERLSPGVRVTVVGADEGVVAWLAGRRPGSRYLVLDGIRDRRDVLGFLRHRRAFRWLAADVVHFNLSTMSSCQWALAAALSVRGLPVVVLEHSPVGTWSSTSEQLKRITSARADAHVAVGHATAREIEELGSLPRGSIRVIHSGVPVVELDPPPRDTDDFTVGMLSRHDPVKGIDLAVRAIGRMGDGVRLVVVGDGPERPALEALVDELCVGDRVELRGWDDRARDLLATFDVYLLPSRLEGFPVTVMEAMQAGLPVVATDVGSVREAIDDGDTGVVVPVGDIDAMVAALRAMRDDPERRLEIGERARVVGLRRFDADAAVRAWEALYNDVLDGSPVSRR